MSRQQIRPSMAELSRQDYDDFAFPEFHSNEAPAVTVSRKQPPQIATAAPQEQPTPGADRAAKPKSRFAQQREREAAEARSRTERFELDLDDSSMQPKLPQLVKDVVEREISTEIPLPPSAFGKTFDAPSPTGFPIATKSTFAPRQSVPIPTAAQNPSEPASQDSLPNLLSSVSKENDQVLASMSDSAIAEEQRQIREEMGLSAGVLAMLEERARKKSAAIAGVPIVPGSSFPREEEGNPVVEEEEGSPEYIRRRFFPNEPPAAENTNLDWMRPGSSSSTAPAPPTFDLNGRLLPPSTSTHSHSHGTHEHHVSSSSTFTIPSLLSLVNSNVSAQRSTAYQIISRILLQSELKHSIGTREWESLRVEATRSAGWGVRDKNMGVASSAVIVLDIIFVQEQREGRRSNGQEAEVVEGKTAVETVVEVFLAMDPFPCFTRHLQFGSLPPHSLDAIVRVLHNIVLHSAGGPKSLAVEELVACKGLLEAISKRCIGVAWPPAPLTSDEPTILPSLDALSFFITLARSSRERARAIWSRRIAETPLRFLSILPWSFEEGSDLCKLGYELLESTLELWIVLGRYGIGTTLRTSASDLLAPLFTYFDDATALVGPDAELAPETIRLAEKWFSLLTIWTTAAIDPHSTEHDIVWTQVDWSVHAAEAHKWMMENGVNGREGLMASIWELLAVWLEGSKVNNAWKGEEERKWLLENVGEDFSTNGPANIVCDQALESFSTGSDASELVPASRLLVSAIRLSTAYAESTSPVTLPFLTFDQGLVRDSFRSLPRIVATTTSWPIVRAFVALLPFIESRQERLAATFNVITLLGAGDEVTARELTNWVLTNAGGATKVDLDYKLERPSLAQAPILKPFVLHAIITSSRAQLVSPLYPTSKDLVLTTSQRPFGEIGSLLQPDWPLFVLNELLKSGSSQVFENLPPGWDSSELDLVKTSLALMRITPDDSLASTPPALLVYDLIKVFMLEKDNSDWSNEQISDVDLFRNESVQYSMSLLLQPLKISSQRRQLRQIDDRPPESTLEGVSSLVSSAPFYRLYTDLLGLYEAISLSHPLFGQILLPPLSMIYPIDYRKLLWTDYSHILKSIRIDVGDAISDRRGAGALAGYLHPVEGNDGMLGAYADALVSGKVSREGNGFLYLVALHHVVATIFDGARSTIARKLAGAVVSQGSVELLRDVLTLSMAEKDGDEVLLPPACFVGSLEVMRVEMMRGLLDGDALEKLDRREL